MIRLGDQVRLTAKERESFTIFVGDLPIPRTVKAMNCMLETAAQLWEESDEPGDTEGAVMTAITRGHKVEG